MDLFGRYEILERIAMGGMAEILLARSDKLGGVDRPCVIKRIKESFSADLQFVSMFIDEARITIGLDHPNIVRLYDFGQHEGTYFMAMEYVDGTDLACLMRSFRESGKLLPLNAAVFICAEALRGLEHAHQKLDHEGKPLGIVHRDVSPQNLLLGNEGDVKLTDFGIAAARNKLTLTTPGTVLGKSAYMAPEQALGELVDGRCDVWALGVILHELVAGERLFADQNDAKTLSNVFEAPLIPPSRARDESDAELDRIVMKSLERERSRRYANASAMLADLDRWLSQHTFERAHLAKIVAEIAWADETVTVRPPLSDRGLALPSRQTSPEAATVLRGTPCEDDPEVRALLDKLGREPSLWTLVALGDRYTALDAPIEACSAYRCAAAMFAHKGLLVQAICAYYGARLHLDREQALDDLTALADIVPGNEVDLKELIERFDAHQFWTSLQGGGAINFGHGRDSQGHAPTPLFGYLAPRAFAQVAEAITVRRVPVGSVIVGEGETGDSLYAIGHGRAVVWCKPATQAETLREMIDEVTGPTRARSRAALESQGLELPAPDRVYLAALADGDFFGEFSFLTGRPRSASVEAITECRMIEMDQSVVDQLFDVEPGFTEPLLRFYKERVVELMMAKSPLFCLLRPADRKALLEGAELVDYGDQKLIVREGEKPGALYFIKRGEVEVFRTDENGLSIFINKLSQGEFFGEIAAITGDRRTVNVRAMGSTSVFRVSRDDLLKVVEREPKLRTLFEHTIASRTAQTAERVSEHRRIIYST